MLLLVASGSATKMSKKSIIKIPTRGYRDLRDTINGRAYDKKGPLWEEYDGGESPFADVLHHNRYNVEELMLPHKQLVPETLDRLRVEQAEFGENHYETVETMLKRALDRVIPYSTAPEEELKLRRRLKELRIYEE